VHKDPVQRDSVFLAGKSRPKCKSSQQRPLQETFCGDANDVAQTCRFYGRSAAVPWNADKASDRKKRGLMGRNFPPCEGSCEKIEDWLFPARSVRRSARSTRWNARSALVFGCGFKTVTCQTQSDSIFSQLQGYKGEINMGSCPDPPAAKSAAKLSQSFDSLGKGGQM
jgi:hypothetical protein